MKKMLYPTDHRIGMITVKKYTRKAGSTNKAGCILFFGFTFPLSFRIKTGPAFLLEVPDPNRFINGYSTSK